jgi:hypothetical protein
MIYCVVCGVRATHICTSPIFPGADTHCPRHLCEYCVPLPCTHCGGPAHQCEELPL